MKNKLTYYATIIFFILYLLIPNSVGNILKVIPVRVTISMALFAVYIIERLLFKKTEYRKMPVIPMIIYALFILASIISIFVTPTKIITLYTILKFVSYGMVAYVLYRCKFDKKQYEMITKVMIGFSTLILIYGIISYVFEFNLNPNGVYKYTGALGRIFTTFNNPIYYGAFVCIYITVLIYYYLNNNKGIKENIALFLMIILALANVFFTFTRSIYLISLFIFGAIFMVEIKNIKKIYIKCIAVFISMILMIAFIPGVFEAVKSSVINAIPKPIAKILQIDKLENDDVEIILDNDNDYRMVYKNCNDKDKSKCLIENADGSMLTRSEFSKLAKRVIKDNFVLGVGFGAYKDYLNIENNQIKYITGKFGYPHNNYLHILAETGVSGLVTFMIVLIGIMVLYAVSFIRHKDKIQIYMIILWIGIMLLCAFESFFYDSQIVPLLIFIVMSQIFSLINNRKDEKENNL